MVIVLTFSFSVFKVESLGVVTTSTRVLDSLNVLAALFFILCLRGLAKQETSKAGIAYGVSTYIYIPTQIPTVGMI